MLMILSQVAAAVKAAIVNHYQIEDVEPQISYPEPQYGDFATNVAFQLAGRLKQPPNQIAEELAELLTDESIEHAVAAGGFINISMRPSFWIAQLKQIKPGYGGSQQGKGVKVEVEFISANPTGPLTIGNARGGYLGDTIASVLDTQGYEVTREYYFNNAGTQITKLIESVKVAAGVIQVPEDEVQYRGAYIQELANKYKSELSSQPDQELAELLTQEILERWIHPAIKKMGIGFDSWFNENDLFKDSRFKNTIQKLSQKGLVYEKEGASWLDTGKLGVAREARVFVKSNGDPTYLAPDIAFHDDLFGRRGFDRAIKVLGPDHLDQFPSVQAAVKALHPDAQLEMASHQWFRLIKEGKELKISKRLGQYVTIEELIDEVGADVARFMTLMRAPETHMDFDFDLAKQQSQKNPLYYVMYSYARAHSIMQQAALRGLSPLDTGDSLPGPAIALVRHITQFPELLQEITQDFGVHRLTFFGIEAARLFHDLYESERIIDLDKSLASRRLYLISQYLVLMKEYFKVMRITPQERMDSSRHSAA